MASRYWVTAGTSNWSTSGAGSGWSLTDGGAGGQVKPTASDDVFFTANSPVCTVDTAGVGLTLNFTGYASTITMTAGLTISGSVTLVAAMTISGASGLIINGTATLTSNGKTWPNALTLQSNTTSTLADNWTVTGTFGCAGGSTGTRTINGNNVFCQTSLTVATNISMAGTTVVNLTGTGTWTSPTGTLTSVIINTSGTITMAAAEIRFNTGTFTYTAGTVVTTGNTFTVAAASTLNTSGIVWNNFTVTGTQSTTLTSDLTLSGTFTFSGGHTTVNGNTIYAQAGVTVSATNGNFLGTSAVVMNGTGTLSNTQTTGTFANTVIIDTTGTITISNLLKITNPIIYKRGLLAGNIVGFPKTVFKLA